MTHPEGHWLPGEKWKRNRSVEVRREWYSEFMASPEGMQSSYGSRSTSQVCCQYATPGSNLRASAGVGVEVAHDAGAVHIVVRGPRLRSVVPERVGVGMVKVGETWISDHDLELGLSWCKN